MANINNKPILIDYRKLKMKVDSEYIELGDLTTMLLKQLNNAEKIHVANKLLGSIK
jgi:hypothetical protein